MNNKWLWILGAGALFLYLRKKKQQGVFDAEGNVNPDYSDFIFTPPVVQQLPYGVVPTPEGWGKDEANNLLYIPVNGGVDGYKVYNYDQLVASLKTAFDGIKWYTPTFSF